jgi:hypothetical protein
VAYVDHSELLAFNRWKGNSGREREPMSIRLSTTRTPGPEIAIQCPRCDRQTSATTYDLDENAALFGLIPLLKLHSNWVECIRCGERLMSSLPARKLAKLSPPELADVVRGRTSLVAKLFATCSVALCWTPGLGLLLGALAFLANRKGRTWKTVSLIGIGLSLIVHLVLAFFLLAPLFTNAATSQPPTAVNLATASSSNTIQSAMASIKPTTAEILSRPNPSQGKSRPPTEAETPPPKAIEPTLLALLAADGRWIVVFSGKDPRAWNTETDGETRAITLDRVPRDVRYLRLKRLDTSEVIIVPITHELLVRQISIREQKEPAARWNGRAEDEFGGRHLGIAEGSLENGPQKKGSIAVQMEGTDFAIGSGFGHEAYGDGQTQHFGWHGAKIPPTAFEIALTSAELDDGERRLLLDASALARIDASKSSPIPENTETASPVTPAVPASEKEVGVKPADDPRWTVLFSGRDPSAWNSAGQGETAARPRPSAPPGMRFLRLRRLDTGEALIIPATRAELDRNTPEGPRRFRWNGTNQGSFGGRHLGIAEGTKQAGSEHKEEGLIAVETAGFDFYVGSGFGHIHHGDGRTQGFAWRGKAIPPVDFEIAVTASNLRPSEVKVLLKP